MKSRKIPSYVQDVLAERNLQAIKLDHHEAATQDEHHKEDPQAQPQQQVENLSAPNIEEEQTQEARDIATQEQNEAEPAFLTPSPEIDSDLRQAGFNDHQISLVYRLAERHLQPFCQNLVEEVRDQARTGQDYERLLQTFGGPDQWERVQKKMLAWAEQNLPTESIDVLAQSYDGIIAIYRLMQPQGQIPQGSLKGDKSDLEGLQEKMRDPRYWRDFDPSYRRGVQHGFQRLYDRRDD